MPILTSGSNVTLTVAAGQILTVQSDAATFDFENPVGTRVGEYAADTVFGPFTAAASVKVTSVQGPVYYELASPAIGGTTTYNPSSVAITGGTISLAASRSLAVNKLAVLGTSIEGQTIDNSGNYGADAALPVANAIMGWPWSEIGDYGVSSDTSGPSGANPGMTSRVASIIAAGYQWCYVGFPINDVTTGLNPDTFTILNMQTIYGQLIAAGVRVIAATGGPTSSLADNTAQAYRDAYAKVQTAIRNYATSYSGIVLANTALVMTNPATGLPFTSPATTKDGLHDNYEGAGRKAQAIVSVVSALVKAQDTSVENLFDPRNYNSNPFAQGDNASGAGGYVATSVTGTGPNGWGSNLRSGGSAVGSRAAARSNTWKQPSQGARLAITGVTNFDGAYFNFGGSPDGGQSLGRYDITWAATTAKAYGNRVKPTVVNGYHYTVITPGTTGGSEPTWTTTEGSFITDGTVVWMCQKTPAVGDQFYAECEVETSGLTANKGAAVRLGLLMVDTTSTAQQQTYCNFVDFSGSAGALPRYLPPTMRLRTPTITMATGYTLRYLHAQIGGFVDAGGSFNLDVFRADIIRVT